VAKQKRAEIKVTGHYAMIYGQKTLIDPLKTDLPDRCKKIWAESMLGCKCELVKKVAP